MEHEQKEEWFNHWFGSPYYHILYKDRDENEARGFLNNLCQHLKFDKTQKILDLACGKGRHSIYLNEQGYDVVGIDLSEDNILHARQFENDGLIFHVHDMREPFSQEEFDFVLNMFTSFGYFETREENYSVVRNVHMALKDGGVFVLDFLNPYTVVNHLEPEQVKEINGIRFEISKDVVDGFIEKNIHFQDQGKDYHFMERVKAIRRTEFLEYFEESGLELKEIFGNYALQPYEKERSERMIFVLKKTNNP